MKYAYDSLDRVSEIKYNTGSGSAFVTMYSYTYDSYGNLSSIEDYSSNEITLYKYDTEGKLVKSYVYDSEEYENLYGTLVFYDDQSRVRSVFHYFDYTCSSGTYYDSTHYSYRYNKTNGNIEKLSISGNYASGTVDPVYDSFGRTTSRTIDFNVNGADAFYNALTYDYVTYGARESGRVSQVISQVGKSSESTQEITYNYTYDANGNITQIKNAGGVIQYKYTYDDLGQLTREDNAPLGYSYVYTYDNAGNITTKKR